MARQKHTNVANPDNDTMDSSLALAVADKVAIEDMPLETLRDYRLYNEEARKLNKKLRTCRYPIKQCPPELHPKQRVRIDRTDGTRNPIPCFISNHLIHFDEELIPGKIYDLPECIVHYLTEKGNPIWGWVNLPDGGKETRQVDKTPRFSISTIYNGGM